MISFLSLFHQHTWIYRLNSQLFFIQKQVCKKKTKKLLSEPNILCDAFFLFRVLTLGTFKGPVFIDDILIIHDDDSLDILRPESYTGICRSHRTLSMHFGFPQCRNPLCQLSESQFFCTLWNFRGPNIEGLGRSLSKLRFFIYFK